MGDCGMTGWHGMLMGAGAIFVGWLLATIQYCRDEPLPKIKTAAEVAAEFKAEYRKVIRELVEERRDG